jgi:hypothetical protein
MILLVGGSAPCLFEDLALAREKFPGSELMLVNGACAAVENAEHVLAGHTDKAEQFARARRAAFPSALPWRLHATRFVRRDPDRQRFPSVTDWWGPEFSSGATSAGKAALIGINGLLAEMVILCGCPMDGSGYFPGESKIGAEIRHETACQRVGDSTKQDRTIIRRYRDTMAKLAQTTFKGRVFSMSGFTREVLGAP